MNRSRAAYCSSYLLLLLLLVASQLQGATSDFAAAEPETCGVDSEQLRKMSEWVRGEELDVRSLIVLKDRSLILEWYAGGVTRDHNHNLFSVTKSVVATLLGAAIQQGKIPNIDTPIGDIFGALDEPRKSAIPLEHLLTMRSGFPVTRGNRASGPQRELFDRLHSSPDRTASILELALANAPGEDFAYNNIDPDLVLSAIEIACDEQALPLAAEMLFDPLGFRNGQWLYPDRKGAFPGGYGLRLRAIDLAKIGQLYLQRGMWNNQQILPETYVAAASSDQTGTGYGYFWWINQPRDTPATFAAKGVRGQQIFVDPSKGLVFVVTADLPPAEVKKRLEKLTTMVLGATHENPLPRNRAAFASLQQELAIAAQYLPATRKQLPPARLPKISEQ